MGSNVHQLIRQPCHINMHTAQTRSMASRSQAARSASRAG